jgi:menaquinone-specific isochorismate synthase
MEEHSISTQDFSNYLQLGALLRYDGKWHLFAPPSKGDNLLEPEDFSVYTRDFFNPQINQVYQTSKHWILSSAQLEALCLEFIKNFDPTSKLQNLEWIEPLQESFQTSFAEIKKKISQSQIMKAVPIVFESAPATIPPAQRAQLILRLLEAANNLWVYGLWDADTGFLGASPELLFDLDSTHIFTMALAGTRPKMDENRLPLLKDSKELQEHQLVVQDILNGLSPFGTPEKSGPHEVEYPSIFHLKTEIKISLRDKISPLQLMESLHPTAALGVAPRNYGFSWMQNLPEQSQRKFFGSPIIFKIKDNHWIAVVAIRNITWDKEMIRIGSGCGIVENSQLDREWNELKAKRTFTKKLLGLNHE